MSIELLGIDPMEPPDPPARGTVGDFYMLLLRVYGPLGQAVAEMRGAREELALLRSELGSLRARLDARDTRIEELRAEADREHSRLAGRITKLELAESFEESAEAKAEALQAALDAAAAGERQASIAGRWQLWAALAGGGLLAAFFDWLRNKFSGGVP